MSAPVTRTEETKVTADKMSTQIAGVNLKGFIVIRSGNLKYESWE